MCVGCVCVGCVCVGCVCREISPKLNNSEDGKLVSSTSHHHPPSLIKEQGHCSTPFPPPSYNIPVEYIQHGTYSVLCTRDLPPSLQQGVGFGIYKNIGG